MQHEKKISIISYCDNDEVSSSSINENIENLASNALSTIESHQSEATPKLHCKGEKTLLEPNSDEAFDKPVVYTNKSSVISINIENEYPSCNTADKSTDTHHTGRNVEATEVDVSNMITRRSKLSATLPTLKFYDTNVTDEELSMLVETINEITNTVQQEPIYSSSFLPYGGINPYVTRDRLPHYKEDETMYSQGHSLLHWRKLFMSLSLADPYTLQAFVDALPYPKHTADSGAHGNSKKMNQRKPPDHSYPKQPLRPLPSEGRFKQIARAKNTPEYLYYVKTVSRDERTESDPKTPRVDGSSWREFQQEIRAWKRSLHRKYEALTSKLDASTTQ